MYCAFPYLPSYPPVQLLCRLLEEDGHFADLIKLARLLAGLS